MNGKDTLTEIEVKTIRELISEKVNASPDRQKAIRRRIRQIGFYYTDFRQDHVVGGYTVEDFNDLIESGAIKIVN